MTIYFTSDLHFEHKNICEFTDRHQVTTQEHHTEFLIDIWNSTVKPQDIVYHLGDFSFNTTYSAVASTVKKLQGQKFFIKGNHDRSKILKELKENNLLQGVFDYKEIKLQDKKVVLFHYPIGSWHQQGRGSIHLHGHCHSNYKNTRGKMLDVGIDSAYKILGEHKLFSEDEVIDLMDGKQIYTTDHHKIIQST